MACLEPSPGSPRGRVRHRMTAENSTLRHCSEGRCLSLRRSRSCSAVCKRNRYPSIDTFLKKRRGRNTTSSRLQRDLVIPAASSHGSICTLVPPPVFGCVLSNFKQRNMIPSAQNPFQGCRSGLPVECEGNTSKYYLEMDYVWNLLEQKHVLLIRGSWLVARSKAVPFVPLPCRQDLPHDVAVDVAEMRRIANRGPTSEILVAISHSWLSSDHPDPDGKLLQELAPVIEAYLANQNYWHNEFGERFDGAFFFAWCSMYQPYHAKLDNDQYRRLAKSHLTVEQQQLHQSSLENMDIWYTHARTEVWMLTRFFPEQKIGYGARGWPTWERTVAELLSSSRSLLDLGLLELNGFQKIDLDRIRDTCRASRRPPSLPVNFRSVIAAKHFTCGECDRVRITENYARNFHHVTNCIRHAVFKNMKWSKEDMIQLFEFLRQCQNLEDLRLGRNQIGDDQCCELAQVLQCCGKLERLHLDNNLLGDVGVKLICKALTLHSNTLKELHIQTNFIGDKGSRALAEVLSLCAKLEQLILDGNQIGDLGVSVFAKELRHCGNLKLLLLGGNQIGDPGASALARGLRNSNVLEWLFLDNNDIGLDGAGALATHLCHCSNLNTLLLQGNRVDDPGNRLLTEALRCCQVCCVAKADVHQSTGFDLWRRIQPPMNWMHVQNTFKQDELLSPQERELWRERQIALLSTQQVRQASIDPSRFEFEYVSPVRGLCRVVGIPTSWEAAKVRLNRSGQDPPEFDGDILPSMIVYETRGPGPKLFGVIDTENIYYHDYGVWYKYQTAVPISIRDSQELV